MSALRDRYFRTLTITATDALKREKALNRAYQLRTFEIEHYWKRATYFWGFQIAIFAAFGLLWQTTTDSSKQWGLRPWTEGVYGIPPENVVGSSVRTKFELARRHSSADAFGGSTVIFAVPCRVV